MLRRALFAVGAPAAAAVVTASLAAPRFGNSPVTSIDEQGQAASLVRFMSSLTAAPCAQCGFFGAAAPPRRFESKVVVITGGGGTFGREGAVFFAKSGAKVSSLWALLTRVIRIMDGYHSRR
jgi:hypothetical protein